MEVSRWTMETHRQLDVMGTWTRLCTPTDDQRNSMMKNAVMLPPWAVAGKGGFTMNYAYLWIQRVPRPAGGVAGNSVGNSVFAGCQRVPFDTQGVACRSELAGEN